MIIIAIYIIFGLLFCYAVMKHKNKMLCVLLSIPCIICLAASVIIPLSSSYRLSKIEKEVKMIESDMRSIGFSYKAEERLDDYSMRLEECREELESLGWRNDGAFNLFWNYVDTDTVEFRINVLKNTLDLVKQHT